MKKLLSFFLIAILGLSLSAQDFTDVISEFPATEDFEGASNPGSHNFFSDYTDEWLVDDSPSNINCPITNGYNSYNFVYCFSSNTSLDATLTTYAFDLRNTDHATLSFWFANPVWGEDIDVLSISYRQSTEDIWVEASEITEANDNWTYMEVPLPTGKMLQIRFEALTNRGFGVYLDDIKVDIPDFPQVSSFPWTWDFDNGMGPFMQKFDGCYKPWILAYGNHSSSTTSDVNQGLESHNDHNALFYSAYHKEAMLISPIFSLGNADSASLKFDYSMEKWGTGIDEFAIYYRTSPSFTWHLLWSRTEPMNQWSSENISLPDLTDTYQIGFWAKGNWGFGVTLDLITIKAWTPEGINEMTSAQSTISAYPNPATDHITVIRNNNDEMFIYNVFGSLVKSTNENIINVSDFAPGVYFIKTSEGTVKFVKSK